MKNRIVILFFQMPIPVLKKTLTIMGVQEIIERPSLPQTETLFDVPNHSKSGNRQLLEYIYPYIYKYTSARRRFYYYYY